MSQDIQDLWTPSDVLARDRLSDCYPTGPHTCSQGWCWQAHQGVLRRQVRLGISYVSCCKWVTVSAETKLTARVTHANVSGMQNRLCTQDPLLVWKCPPFTSVEEWGLWCSHTTKIHWWFYAATHHMHTHTFALHRKNDLSLSNAFHTPRNASLHNYLFQVGEKLLKILGNKMNDGVAAQVFQQLLHPHRYGLSNGSGIENHPSIWACWFLQLTSRRKGRSNRDLSQSFCVVHKVCSWWFGKGSTVGSEGDIGD